jgi:creatinine amidohydrolase/Fe(II)-dependent formamide hydrolase-like protein
MYLKHLRPHQLQEAVARGCPLLVPAGCVETHGPHMAIGHDTLIVEEICARVVAHPELVDQGRLGDDAPWYCRQDEERNSWTANARHGRLIVDAVVEAWVGKIQRAGEEEP